MIHPVSNPSAKARGMALALFAILLLVGATLRADPSAAEAAFAVGLPGNIAKDGLAIGSSVNKASMEEARRDALELCRTFMEAPSRTRALCRVTETFRDQCAAVALDPKAGTPGAGWAIADTEAMAERRALALCVETAGAGRQQYCKITLSHCDGTAR